MDNLYFAVGKFIVLFVAFAIPLVVVDAVIETIREKLKGEQ